ncbi:DUF2470 domain-containing protein [Streptomyces sp. NPDC002187]|uniref:DUF2470 domain-containing protein n=1 Tax=Streptomyces sp. NPDC002187 TaxID=3364637 RepID=UPI0036C09745
MSTVADTALPQPSAAERVRSTLARAASLSLTTHGQGYDLIGLHSVDPKGQITLHPQADSPLMAETACAPRGSLAALLEFTDIAPTAVRDRVRARVTVSGWLTPADGDDGPLRLDTARVTLRTPAEVVDVGLDEMTLTEPDPLAIEEAAMLTHLADAHKDMVTGLLALAGPRMPRGMTRAVPLALDRHGITLRCEYTSGHYDLRFLFPVTARDAAEAGEQILQLLAAPGPCPHRRPSPRRP